ncbi:mucin-2 isoform X3 [Condylostylus longicornis]|uniref:mucin-2 isoform X3 n=1 Tax=Condylostylus longicornis TaxID=2530218 RepID=UPI00244DAD5A|nr:mucin-2 isoform X3 [Condylostylus longicornis]
MSPNPPSTPIGRAPATPNGTSPTSNITIKNIKMTTNSTDINKSTVSSLKATPTTKTTTNTVPSNTGTTTTPITNGQTPISKPPPVANKNSLPKLPAKKLSALDKLPFGFAPIQNFTGFIRSRSTTPTRSLRSRSTTPMIDEAEIKACQRMSFNRFGNQKSIDEIDNDDIKNDIETNNENGNSTVGNNKSEIPRRKHSIVTTIEETAEITKYKDLNGYHESQAKLAQSSKGKIQSNHLTNGDITTMATEKEKSPPKSKLKLDKSSRIEKKNINNLKLKPPLSSASLTSKKTQNIEECVTSPDAEYIKTIPLISQPETPLPTQSQNQPLSTNTSNNTRNSITKSNANTNDNINSNKTEKINQKHIDTQNSLQVQPNPTSSSSQSFTSTLVTTNDSNNNNNNSQIKNNIPKNEAHVHVKKKSKITASIQITDTPGFKLSKLPSTSDILAAVSNKLKNSSLSCDNDNNNNNINSNNVSEPPTPIVDIVEITSPNKKKSSNPLSPSISSASSKNVLSMVDSKINYVTENQKTVTTNTTIDDTLSSSKLSITEGFQLYKLTPTSDILAAVDSTIESSTCVNNKYMTNGLNDICNISNNNPTGLSRGFKLSKKSSSSNLHALLQMNSVDSIEDDDDLPQTKQKNTLETVVEDDAINQNCNGTVKPVTELKTVKIKNITSTSNEEAETIVKKESGKVKKKKIVKKLSTELAVPDNDPNGELKITKLSTSSDVQAEVSKDPNTLTNITTVPKKKIIKVKKVKADPDKEITSKTTEFDAKDDVKETKKTKDLKEFKGAAIESTDTKETKESFKNEVTSQLSPISDADFTKTLFKTSEIGSYNARFERSISLDKNDLRSSVPPEFGTLRKLPSSSDILAAVEEKFESNYLNNRSSRSSSVVGVSPSIRAQSQSPGPLEGCLSRSSSAADIVRRVRAQSVINTTKPPSTPVTIQPQTMPFGTAMSSILPTVNPTAVGLNPLAKLPSSSDILASVESKFESSYLNNRPTNVLTKTPIPIKPTAKKTKTKKIRVEQPQIEIPNTPAPVLNTELLARATAINNMAKLSTNSLNNRHSIHGTTAFQSPDTSLSLSMVRSPSPLSTTSCNLSSISSNTFSAPLGKPPPKLNSRNNNRSPNRPFSRSISLTTSDRCSRSITPRRIFPQTYSKENSCNLEGINELEQSPVVFDANLQFVMGCNKQPLHQSFHALPSHQNSRTLSNRLSEEIANFLKKTDHVTEEWKQIGKRNSVCGTEDTISLIERQREQRSMEPFGEYRLGRSKSAQNILMKGFQLTNKLPSTSRGSSLSRSISFLEEDDDESDAQTLKDIDELSEMTVDLAEERSASNIASERLEAETAERLKLEKELQESLSKVKNLQEQSEKLEMELICAKSDLNGISEDEDGDGEDSGGVYKLKYERVARELEFTKRRLQTQHEHDLEQLIALKKQLEKKLADAYEEVEEQRQVVGQWKRKAQKMTNEMNDLRMLLEEQNGRNNLLEKKQRKFDSECQALQDAARQERQAKDRLSREKDVLIAEKFTLEQNLADTRLELELKEEKLIALQRELEEMTFSGGTEEEVAQLRRSKMDLERRLKEQEEELDEMAGQVQLLEQAKLRLEMTMETMRKEARREAQQRDDELEEARGSAYKKIKALECQLETEHEERTLLLREKHELERRLQFAEDQDRHDRQAEEAMNQKLKRELKKYKALLKDAHAQLERLKADSPGKAIIRQLRNQLEDAEAARTLAVKARHTAESELQDIQTLLDEAQRAKQDAEDKATIANRDRTELQAQIEENEEEMAELMKKYSAAVKQLNNEQTAMSEYEIKISELEGERNTLKEQVAELTTRLENVENMSDPTAAVQSKRLELRTKELESRLELEQATKARLEIQANRHKDALEKIQNDLSQSRMREMAAQDNVKKAQKSLRELREEFHTISNREQDSASKRKDLEKKIETLEAECLSLRNDLRLALQRIADLQQAMEEGDDDVTESESDSSDVSVSDLDDKIKVNHSKKSSIVNGVNETKVVLKEKSDSNSPKITVTSPSTATVNKALNGDSSFA